MMRYQMLLKELVKYAERARLDCASDLQAAVNAMLRVPKAANDALHLNLLEGFREKIDERKLLSQVSAKRYKTNKFNFFFLS